MLTLLVCDTQITVSQIDSEISKILLVKMELMSAKPDKE